MMSEGEGRGADTSGEYGRAIVLGFLFLFVRANRLADAQI